VLLGLLGLLLSLVHLLEDLLVVVNELLVLFGTSARLVSVRSGKRSRVVSELSLLLVRFSLLRVSLGGVGDVVGE